VRALVKSIGVNALALYIALFLFIYYSKNKEYCLDIIRLECLYHRRESEGEREVIAKTAKTPAK